MRVSDDIIRVLDAASLDDLQKVMEYFGDDQLWRSFYNEQETKTRFDLLIKKIDESKRWGKERNKEKGDLLEEAMKLLFSRFVNQFECCNLRNKDNEIDVDVKFNEVLSTPFIKKLNLHFICECKNKASASVDVGMVTKLVELCETNQAGLGIFVSHKGISGSGWKYGEGKRRKLFLSHKIPIISFKISELKCFSSEGYNFYTEIRKKYKALVDELDYDAASLENIKYDNSEFTKILIDTICELEKIGIISQSERKTIEERIFDKYGHN